MFLTDTAKLADVVLPATATWCEAEGTVTNSERRVQRVRKALEPPAGARDDIEIICEIARRLGADWGHPSAEDLWNELRTLSPMHAGMSYQRLEELGGIQWPCPDEQHPGELFLHARLWEEDPAKRGAPAPFTPVEQEPPVDELSAGVPDPAHHRAPAGLVQHRRAVGAVRHAAPAAGDAQPLARGRGPARHGRGRGGRGCRRAAGRWRCRSTSTRRCGPGSPS